MSYKLCKSYISQKLRAAYGAAGRKRMQSLSHEERRILSQKGIAARRKLLDAHILPDKECKFCGKLFRPRPSNYLARTFCSLTCHYSSQRTRTLARRARCCVVCGMQFASVVQATTCSKKCGYVFRKLKHRKPAICVTCGREFWPATYPNAKHKWCSLKCYRQYRNQHGWVSFTCPVCAVVFKREYGSTKRSKRHFCSRRCARMFHCGENSPAYRGGSNPNRGTAWIPIAELVRERDGRICRKCGKTEEVNGQKLSVDHVWPWRMFDDKASANLLGNLVSLCRSCHSRKGSRAEALLMRGDRQEFDAYCRSIGDAISAVVPEHIQERLRKVVADAAARQQTTRSRCCANCGVHSRVLVKARCHTCYNFYHKYNKDRVPYKGAFRSKVRGQSAK